jgi:dTDP-4-dehydrorhamnose reductase
MRVLVTGAAGQLGAVIVDRFRAAGHEVVPATRRDADLTRDSDVARLVARAGAELLINCAAFNDVDGAEAAWQTALDVNAFAVRSLARAATARGAALVHYGTDFVFDGAAERPYVETDPPHPESVYASSKYLGEQFAADVDRHYVLRVESLFGGPAARSSVDRIIAQLTAGRPARVFVDRVVSPSYVQDVAEATLGLIERAAPPGLYHCVNTGHTTWLGLAREIASRLGADANLLEEVRVADVALKARRPRFAALDNRKLQAAGIPMPTWQDALARYLVVHDRRRDGR